MGHYQLRNRVHGEGIGCCICGSRRGMAICEDGVVDESLLGHDRMRSDCRVYGSVVAEAAGETCRAEVECRACIQQQRQAARACESQRRGIGLRLVYVSGMIAGGSTSVSRPYFLQTWLART